MIDAPAQFLRTSSETPGVIGYRDPVEVYIPPAEWTPEHVLHRMVLAFETLRAVRVTVGPRGYGSCMPPHIREFADHVSARSAIGDESPEQADARYNADNALRSLHRPTSHEITLMTEAIAWPGRYLRHAVKGRIHIAAWARKRAWRGEGPDNPITIVFNEARRIAGGLRADRVVVT